jgi:drug/metabolite transporter (DMT)-like permease
MPRWVLLSLLSAFGYGLAAVITTGATGVGGVGAIAWTICSHMVGTFLFGIALMLPLPSDLAKDGLRDIKRSLTSFLPLVILIALLFWVADVSLNASYTRAPNPGYCDSVSDLESVIGAVIAAFLFNAPISTQQKIGMTLAVFSLHFLQS